MHRTEYLKIPTALQALYYTDTGFGYTELIDTGTSVSTLKQTAENHRHYIKTAENPPDWTDNRKSEVQYGHYKIVTYAQSLP